MELFGHIYSWVELFLLAVLLVAFAYQLYFYLRYIAGVLRQNRRRNKGKVSYSMDKPPVSVIIAAKDEEDNLRKFLVQILEQDYPEFEVIVINDASEDGTEDVCKALKEKYPYLHTTFVPKGTKNISTKKLAITLGVKAAKYDLLLFTDADCYPQSNLWIDKMVRNFTPQTDFVLGYGAYEEEKTMLNHLITYDTLFINLQYMGMAFAGKPYMGVGRNLAYRKSVFFREKGFSSSLNLLSGDDDLMVNKASCGENTRAEISSESITWSVPKKTFKNWYYQKIRHLSSSAYYKKSTKLNIGIEPVCRGAFYLFFVLIMFLGSLNVVLAALALFLLRYIMQFVIVNRSSKLFLGRTYVGSLLLFDIFLPLLSLYVLLTGKSRKKNMKWR